MTAEPQVATLTDFLLARLAEDEATAIAAQCEPVYGVGNYGDTSAEEVIGMALNEGVDGPGIDHYRRWSPARVLAEVAAKRKILEDATAVPTTSMRHVLRVLASVYRDHPAFREEWAL